MRAPFAASLALLVALAAAAPSRAAAGLPLPARTGESGLLDVPDADVVGLGNGLLGAELRLDRPSDGKVAFGPFPVYAVAGLGERLEGGVTMREWGQPGDRRPSRFVFGTALKLQLAGGERRPFSLAVDGTLDRIGGSEVAGARLIASTPAVGRIRFSAFVGGEFLGATGVTYGGALALLHQSGVEAIAEGLGGPRGPNVGLAFRWRAMPTLAVQVGANWLPKDDGFRVSVGFGFGPAVRARPSEFAPAPAEAPAAAGGPGRLAYVEERPHFKLRLRTGEVQGTDPRHLQHAEWRAPVAAASAMPTRQQGSKAPALSVDEILEGQVRDAETQVDARDRRLRATAEQLAARAAATDDEAKRLAEREREIASREQQLDAREKKVPPRGAPTQQQRQLESLEAQLAAQERQLAAQERSFAPTVEAAQGREADAMARADLERQEYNRLIAGASSTPVRAQQLELRKQAVAAKNRQLAALEGRLVAQGERIDGVERGLRTRGERLDAWQRRLDTRAERLDLLERRALGGAAGPDAAGARPGEPGKDAKGQKDKAVFVMVVKSPTAVVKGAAGAAAAGAAAVTPAPLHAGVAVEKAVAAATVVTFGSPSATLSELDLETIDSIAKLAAREGTELLIWARAKDPGLMGEAQRRAAEIKSRVISAGPLDARQIVTRITTRPGAPGVDVVVSALRDQPVAGAAPAPGATPSASAAPAAPVSAITTETGRRVIREAVVAAQPAIEGCVGQLIVDRRLSRAEGVLKLTVSAQGKILQVATGDGDLSGADLELCLTRASTDWKFPKSDTEYVVDVPITIIRGGSGK